MTKLSIALTFTAMISGRQRLRQWMTRAKVNQRQTAKILNCHEVYVSQILAGLRTPGLENALLIERETGIPVESWARSELNSTGEATPETGDNVNEAK